MTRCIGRGEDARTRPGPAAARLARCCSENSGGRGAERGHGAAMVFCFCFSITDETCRTSLHQRSAQHSTTTTTSVSLHHRGAQHAHHHGDVRAEQTLTQHNTHTELKGRCLGRVAVAGALCIRVSARGARVLKFRRRREKAVGGGAERGAWPLEEMADHALCVNIVRPGLQRTRAVPVSYRATIMVPRHVHASESVARKRRGVWPGRD